MNWGLLGKWWWRFHTESNALWRRVIVSLYGKEGGLAGSRVRGRNTVWTSIINIGKVLNDNGIPFSESFRTSLGSGEGVRFWEDRWVGDRRLKDRFTRLFALESDREVTVRDRGERRGGEWVWKWGWRREPRGREIGELEELLRVIGTVQPREGERDRVYWDLEDQEGFSVRRLRRIIEEVRVTTPGNVIVTKWSKAVPQKVCIFFWRAFRGRLPTRTVLNKMGIDLDNILCLRCGEVSESVDHALVTCSKTKVLWRHIGRWWGINLDNATTIADVLEASTNRGNHHKGERRWVATVWSMLYFIWGNRNKCVFDNVREDLVDKFFELQLKAFDWITRRDPQIKVDMQSWLNQPFEA